MGQQEVFQFLTKMAEQEPHRWFSTREIADSIGISIGSCGSNLARIRASPLPFVRYKPTVKGPSNTRAFIYQGYNHKKSSLLHS